MLLLQYIRYDKGNFNGEKNKAQKNLMDGAASQQAASSVHLGGAAPAITTGFSPLSTQGGGTVPPSVLTHKCCAAVPT